MKIKRYYCSYCKKFLAPFQVYDYYERDATQISLRCKKCNRIVEIEPEFKEFLAQKHKD